MRCSTECKGGHTRGVEEHLSPLAVKVARWVGNHLPRAVVYWAVIRAGANYSSKVDPHIHPDAMGIKEWTEGALVR